MKRPFFNLIPNHPYFTLFKKIIILRRFKNLYRLLNENNNHNNKSY